MIWRQIICGLLVVSVLLLAQSGAAQAADPAAAPQDDRLPVPDKAALDKARRLLKDVFKDEYARLRDAETKLQLFDTLVQQSDGVQDDPTSSYAMLQEACELAIDVGDPDRAQRVATAIAERFVFDSRELFAGSLERMVSRPLSPEAKKAITDSAVRCSDEALSLGKYGLARRFADVALAAARKAKDATAIKRAAETGNRVSAVEQLVEAKQHAELKLSKSPDDPLANLSLGKYLCFVERDVSAGLPYLAKGSDPVFKGLAQASLPHPPTAEEVSTLAERWWAAAGKAKVQDKAILQFVAGHFYSDALPGLTGLARIKAEHRLDELRLGGVKHDRAVKAAAALPMPQIQMAAPQLLLREDFDDPTSGWPEEINKATMFRWAGYDQGRYFLLRNSAGYTSIRFPKPMSNFACAVVGRILGDAGTTWGVAIDGIENRLSVLISLSNDQKVLVRPFSDGSPGPSLGPFTQAQIHKGENLNKLVVAVHDSILDIYVNGARVCEPAPLPNSDTVKLRLVAKGPNKLRAEFEHVEAYALPSDAAQASVLLRELSRFDQAGGAAAPPTKELTEREVAQWVISMGGAIAVAPPAEKFGPLSYISNSVDLPAKPFPLVAIGLANNLRVTDQDMSRIEKLARLAFLRMDGTQLGNETLVHASRVRSLQYLNISGTSNTDAGMVTVSKMPQLIYLYARNTDMTDVGVDLLSRLPNLELLGLSDTRISDATVEKLKRLGKLSTLHIGGNRFSSAGIRKIGELSLLTELGLASTATSDADLLALGRLPKLSTLFLKDTPITDRGLDILAAFPALTTLTVDQTKVTQAGIERFKKQRPNCLIYTNWTR